MDWFCKVDGQFRALYVGGGGMHQVFKIHLGSTGERITALFGNVLRGELPASA